MQKADASTDFATGRPADPARTSVDVTAAREEIRFANEKGRFKRPPFLLAPESSGNW